MMDRAKLLERLMITFVGEIVEHVRTLNAELLALERAPDGPERAERFKTLLRAAHSLKGASRSVGVGLIEEACHRLEEVLLAARDGRVPMEADLFGLLYAMADAFEEAGQRLREQHDLAASPLAALLPRLDVAAAAIPARDETVDRPAALPPPAPAFPPSRPPAVPPPVLATTDLGVSRTAPDGWRSGARAEKSGESQAVVRVAADKLDALLTRSGELLVARRRVEARGEALAGLRLEVARWSEEWRAASHARGGEGAAVPAAAAERLGLFEKELERFALAFDGDRRHLARAAGLLDEEVRRARMLPFSEGCEGLERAARDVAQGDGKLVELVVEGGDVEIDRAVLEGLKDPITHLVRNAVGHGVERPEARREAGKPDAARVRVAAALRGAHVEVVVEDDGAGLDLDALRATLLDRGLAVPADRRDLMDTIFLPGLSTASRVTSLSGRGVGLDVVKSRVEACHGTVGVTTEPGRGTRFTLAVPLTLTTLRAVLLRAGGETFALAVANVERLVRVDPTEIRAVAGRGVLAPPGSVPLTVASLAELVGLPDAAPVAGEKRPGLVVVAGERRAVVLVDELIAEREVTVKSLGDRVRRVRGVSGATIMPDGRVALVLNAAALARAAPVRAPAPAPARSPESPNRAGAGAAARKRVLVVDDSVTTRTLEAGILEAAGYEVMIAVDGEDGWRILQQHGADLVISDVEMPRMDGFALTKTVRRSSRFAGLPIVLFTSRGSDHDRARGIEVGADAYIVKDAFNRNDLLETIAQLL